MDNENNFRKYIKLAEGVEALVKLHKKNVKDLAIYLEKYVDIKEQ